MLRAGKGPLRSPSCGPQGSENIYDLRNNREQHKIRKKPSGMSQVLMLQPEFALCWNQIRLHPTISLGRSPKLTRAESGMDLDEGGSGVYASAFAATTKSPKISIALKTKHLFLVLVP